MKGDLNIAVARDVASNLDDQRIYTSLLGFVARYRRRSDIFQSFAVVFEHDGSLDEMGFEDAL